MKNYLLYIVLILSGFSTIAQNMPDFSTPSSGTPPDAISYPYNFNASPNSGHSTFNYQRSYMPLLPMTYIPSFDSTKGTSVIVNTKYTDGWGRTVMAVNRNNGTKDVIQPYSYKTSDTQLTFLPYPDSLHSKFYPQVYTRQFDYYKEPVTGYDNCAYIKSVSSRPSGVSTQKTFAAGKELSGNDRGTTTTFGFNDSNEVLLLIFDSTFGGEICPSYYQPRQLRSTLRVNSHGEKTIEYRDKNDRIVCRKVWAGSGAGNGGWLVTCYMYDLLGRLIFIVPPKACAAFYNSNICMQSPYDYCFGYQYDEFGSCVSKRVPGKLNFDLAVYNDFQQAVMVQDPNETAKNQWMFTVYDKLGRVAFAGRYTGSETYTYWDGVAKGNSSAITHYYPNSTVVPAQNTLEYWINKEFTEGIDAYPDSLYGCEIMAYNYYDNYYSAPANLHAFSTRFSADYLSQPGFETPTPFLLTQGKLVASKIRIMDNGVTNNFTNTPWVTTIYFYDEKGHIIQTHTKNPWNNWDTATTQYDFAGHAVLNISSYHLWSGLNKRNTKIYTRYTYGGKTGRLVAVDQKTDHDSSWFALADYDYDDLGRVKTKWLGGDAGGTAEQQDYAYDIQGRLTGINKQYLGYSLTNLNNVSYASRMCYEDPGFSEKRYDGKMSGYYWQSESDTNSLQRAYGYEYDSAGRMIHANYEDFNNGSWNQNLHDFTVSNLAYDENGNIQTMNQRGPNTSGTPDDIDLLNYSYNANQLQSVSDGGQPSNIHAFGYNTTTNTANYQYDSSGNLRYDNSKGIINVAYDYFNKPIRITKTADSLQNIYLANGALLQKTVTEGGVTNTYRYWGPFVTLADTLQYILNQEGRARWLPDSNMFKYDFFVKDHQGNVRTVITEDKSEGLTLQAGFELQYANVEESVFDQIAAVREYSPAGTPDDVMAARLNGAEPDHRIGAAVLVHAMAGDQISLKAYGYYEDTSTVNMNTYSTPEDVLGSMVTALKGGSGIGIDPETGMAGISNDKIDQLLNPTNYSAYDALVSANTDATMPRTYLNYLVFDESMNIIADQCQVVQLIGGPNTWHELHLHGDVTLGQNGFVFIYMSGTSNMNSWVDNVHFVTIKGRLLQEQHYYPHGLEIDAGYAGPSLKSNYLFEGNKLQGELGLEWSDFNARQYDQQIGRFTSVDPLADNDQELFTPYHFVSNDPANFVDPLGMMEFGGYLKEVVITAKRKVVMWDMPVDSRNTSGEPIDGAGGGGGGGFFDGNGGFHPGGPVGGAGGVIGNTDPLAAKIEKMKKLKELYDKRLHQRTQSSSQQLSRLSTTAGTIAIMDGPEPGPADILASLVLTAGIIWIELDNETGTHYTVPDPTNRQNQISNYDNDPNRMIPNDGYGSWLVYPIGATMAVGLYQTLMDPGGYQTTHGQAPYIDNTYVKPPINPYYHPRHR